MSVCAYVCLCVYVCRGLCMCLWGCLCLYCVCLCGCVYISMSVGGISECLGVCTVCAWCVDVCI